MSDKADASTNTLIGVLIRLLVEGVNKHVIQRPRADTKAIRPDIKKYFLGLRALYYASIEVAIYENWNALHKDAADWAWSITLDSPTDDIEVWRRAFCAHALVGVQAVMDFIEAFLPLNEEARLQWSHDIFARDDEPFYSLEFFVHRLGQLAPYARRNEVNAVQTRLLKMIQRRYWIPRIQSLKRVVSG